MHRIIPVIFSLLLATGLHADGAQPPQLLGVWYGSYSTGDDSQPQQAQMWMLVSWQLSQDGWSIAGHNRWNIMDSESGAMHPAESAGRHAEHFDRFTGQIARDGRTVTLTEKTTGNRIEATLESADKMRAVFHDADSDDDSEDDSGDSLFTVSLARIDTHYTPGEAVVKGIDVSHHSGSVDWEKVKAAGFRFAYVKASEGVDNPDAMFDQHWKDLSDAGLARGAYHFYVTEDDPVEQARFFASRIKADPGNLPPALDVELLGANTTGDMTQTLMTFLQTLEKEVGVKPILYTGSKFWDANYEPVFSDYGLWMAEYGVKMPKVPFGWDNWLFWQHAANQAVDGVEKSADINLLHPDRNLDQLAGAAGDDD